MQFVRISGYQKGVDHFDWWLGGPLEGGLHCNFVRHKENGVHLKISVYMLAVHCMDSELKGGWF